MGKSKAEIDRAVRETAELLKLTPMLARASQDPAAVPHGTGHKREATASPCWRRD